MPELLIVLVLGLLEGLTEFIPVSSTGHLILLGSALGFEGERANAFDIFIQLGAILAVVILYLPRFLNLLDFSGREGAENGFKGKQGITKLALVTTPALIVGFALHHYVKEHLFRPVPVAVALIVGGAVMIWIERRKSLPVVNSLEGISFRGALIIGLFQCLSLWPGTSRSGSTIVGGMLVGLDRKVAAEFSFLAAVPIMCAATGYDLLKSLRFLHAGDILPFGIGFVVALISAMAAIKFFVGLLRRYTLVPFAWYRIILGIIVLLVAQR